MSRPHLLLAALLLAFSSPLHAQLTATAALDFDGVDDRVWVPHDAALDGFNDFTIEFWLKCPSQTAWKTCVQKLTSNSGSLTDDAYSIGVNNDRIIIELMTGSNYTAQAGNVVVTDMAWHHIALSRLGSAVTLYVDGNVDAPFTHTGQLNTIGPIPLNFGSNTGPQGIPGGFLQGSLDEIRIWNVHRSQALIRDLAHAELTGAEPGLVGYWRFEAGLGQVAFDWSAPAYDGTLGNTMNVDPSDPTWTTDSAPVSTAALVPQGAPQIGTVLPLKLVCPVSPLAPWVCAFSFSTSPGIPLPGGRTIPLTPDDLMLFAFQPNNGFFYDTSGLLDANGCAQTPTTIFIPNAPALANLTFYASALTTDPTLVIGFIAPAIPITITL